MTRTLVKFAFNLTNNSLNWLVNSFAFLKKKDSDAEILYPPTFDPLENIYPVLVFV